MQMSLSRLNILLLLFLVSLGVVVRSFAAITDGSSDTLLGFGARREPGQMSADAAARCCCRVIMQDETERASFQFISFDGNCAQLPYYLKLNRWRQVISRGSLSRQLALAMRYRHSSCIHAYCCCCASNSFSSSSSQIFYSLNIRIGFFFFFSASFFFFLYSPSSLPSCLPPSLSSISFLHFEYIKSFFWRRLRGRALLCTVLHCTVRVFCCIEPRL